MNSHPTPPQGKVALEDMPEIRGLGLETNTLDSLETPRVTAPRKPQSSGGSWQKSRPVRPMRVDSASMPDFAPLLRSRMTAISGIVLLGSLLALLVVQFSKPGAEKYKLDMVFYGHLVGLVANLIYFASFRTERTSPTAVFLLHKFFFLSNSVIFVTVPLLQMGLRPDVYNASSLLVLLRSVFVPCVCSYSLIFGLILWSIYPLSVLIGSLFSPLLAADLADPALRLNFLMGNLDIGLSLAVGLMAVYYFHGLRMQAFEAEQAGSYRLLDKLGEGGMGEVYRARHALLPRPTAVKMLRADHVGSPTALKRFEREVRAVSELTHPNTIAIYDFGKTESGNFYYAMEYLEGVDLQRLVEDYGALSAPRAVYILDQILGSLGEAHWRGILHRDVKPSNVYLTVRGRQYDFAKVLDFGLVKEMGPDPQFTAGLTADSSITGTPLYMAPERFYGNEQVDHRSDLYAVGAVAYYLLAGRPVFDSKNPMQALIDHARTPPTPPRELGISLSDELQAVILRSLEKDPVARFATAEEFSEALHQTPEWGTWSQDQARQWWSRHLPAAGASTSQPITPSS